MTIARLRLPLLVTAVIGATALFASGGGAAVAASAPTNTASPAISGTPTQGQALQTTTGSWAGTTPIDFTYQWQRCDTHGNACSFIGGATTSTYTLGASDVGDTIRSFVTGHNSAGTGTGQSNHTSTITGAAPPTNTQLPAISGTTAIGNTLTASNGGWSGTSPIDYSYRWERCNTTGGDCASISGATKAAYTVVNGDEGHTIRVSVRAANSAGEATATSNATGIVNGGSPANTSAPTISGTTTQAQTLTASNGTWTGPQPITYTYLWERCDTAGNNCATITGAHAQTYVLATADVGHTMRAIVTAKNSAGSNHVETSAVGPVASNSTLPPGAVKLPDGEISVPAASIADNDRLTIVSVKYAPGSIHGRGPVTATIKVIDDNKYVISGALVYVLPAPRNFANHPPEVPTAQDGTAAVTVTLTSAAPHSGSLLLFVRARTPQGDVLAGSSTRRLIQVRIFPS